MTASRVGASISPRMVSPFGETPSHLKTGMRFSSPQSAARSVPRHRTDLAVDDPGLLAEHRLELLGLGRVPERLLGR